MQNWIKVAVSAVAVAIVAGTAAASATPTARALPQPISRHTPVANPASSVDTTVESKYTPIPPCRIVDTRIKGGPIGANSTRSFHALGQASFAAQGGTSCDIPSAATAVTGSVIATGATGSGYFKVYGYGASEPTASFLNYVPTPTLSASGTIPVSNSTFDFTVKAVTHPAQVVIQLTGYFIRPMWVEVAANGTKMQGSRTTAVSTLGKGLYEVDFDRTVTACAYAGNSYTAGISVEVQSRVNNVHGVFLALEDSTGALANAIFYLTVTC